VPRAAGARVTRAGASSASSKPSRPAVTRYVFPIQNKQAGTSLFQGAQIPADGRALGAFKPGQEDGCYAKSEYCL